MIGVADGRALRELGNDTTWQENEPLAAYTTIRIGGPAELLAIVQRIDQLAVIMTYARRHHISLTFLGGGSNVLVSDEGISGLVVVNRCRRVTHLGNGLVWAESGASFAGLARQVMAWGLAGLTWAVSIPGSVGGAVVGNAGAYGGEVASVLRRVVLLFPDGSIINWQAEQLRFGYRHSVLGEAARRGDVVPLVLAAEFQLPPGDVESMRMEAEKYLLRRRQTQPREPSMGSVFKNPPGDYAGRLLEQAGLKGARIGQAEISPVHANFIVNRGKAKAADVYSLLKLAQEQVHRRFRVILDPEVVFLGNGFGFDGV